MLYSKLTEYAKSSVYPFHMPGHKRNAGFMHGLPCDIDITEIYGFDDLHDPQGVLLETSKLAARLYGSREAFLLVNGSTVGILAAIGGMAGCGGKVLAAANCHRSVSNAAMLFGLDMTYITPDTDEPSGVPCSIAPSAVESTLHCNPEIKLVVITSPTYEGVVSDIEAIADIAHKADAALLVDCAHGAHFGFSEGFPKSPVTLGADAVVMSLHKTLPALTQCSLLHLCSDRMDADAIRQMLYVLQTSSPSYVLMASIDCCLRLLESDAGRLFREYESNLAVSKARVRGLKNLSMLQKKPCFFGLDPGKIVIVTQNTSLSGDGLADILRERYQIELERAYLDYAIAMTSICDTRDGLLRLADALIEVDRG